MVVQQVPTQTDSILCTAQREEEDPPSGVLETPLQFQEHQRPVSWGEHSVSMVALECELALAGRLSPPADTPPMSLPYQSVSSSSGEDDTPRPCQAPSSCLASNSIGCRSGLKRKLYGRDDIACEENSFMGIEDVSVMCGRCGEERENKRRRLSHGCSEADSAQEKEAMEMASERPQDVFEVSLNVEHTLDDLTNLERIKQSLDRIVQTLDIDSTPGYAQQEVGSVEHVVSTPANGEQSLHTAQQTVGAVTTPGNVDQETGSVEYNVTTQGHIDQVSGSGDHTFDVITSGNEDDVTTPCHDIVTSCHDIVPTSCHDIVTTSCHDIVVTTCHDLVTTSCHDLVTTSRHDLVTTSCHDLVTTSCHDIVASSCHASAMESEETPLDVVVETSETVTVDDSAVAQQSSHTALEVDMGENTTRDHSYTAPLFPAANTSNPQQSDRYGSGDDVSSEEGDDDAFGDVSPPPRPRRISPFLNTPKQRKEERRKILKLSIHKMRAVEDPELFLRRSVLINNTMKRLQRELREEKMRNSPRRNGYGLYRRPSLLNPNSYVLHDETFGLGDSDRITDDMTDTLVTCLEATSSHVVVPTPSPSPRPVVSTPSPSPCPLNEPDTSFMEFPAPCQEAATSSSLYFSDVTSTVADCTSSPSSDLTPSLAEPCSSLSDHPFSTSLEWEDMTSSVCDLTSSDCSSTSSSPALLSCNGVHDDTFNVSHSVIRDCQTPSSSCSSESQKMKQMFPETDVVFKTHLIHAMGDS